MNANHLSVKDKIKFYQNLSQNQSNNEINHVHPQAKPTISNDQLQKQLEAEKIKQQQEAEKKQNELEEQAKKNMLKIQKAISCCFGFYISLLIHT